MAQDGEKKTPPARVTIRLPVTTEKGRRGRFRLVPPPGHDQAPWWRRLTPFHLALIIIQLFLLAAIVQYYFFKDKPTPGRLLPTPAALLSLPRPLKLWWRMPINRRRRVLILRSANMVYWP